MKTFSQQQTILIVDDDAITRDALAIVLEASGYHIYKAGSGAEAIKISSNEAVDMVLLDVVMPDIDGFSVCRQLRLSKKARHIPIIMLTALHDIESTEAAFDAGATDFIGKPINWALLEQRLKYAFRSYHNQQELVEQKAKLKKAQDIAHLVYAEVDEQLQFIHFPLEQSDIFGIPLKANHLSLESFMEHIHTEDRERFLDSLNSTLSDNINTDINFRLFSQDKQALTIQQNTSVRDHQQKNIIELTLQDISEQIHADRLIQYHTYFDPVTQLPNLKRLHEDLDALLGIEHSDRLAAILLIDIGRLKHISQTLGQFAANRLLQLITQRLEEFQSDITQLYRTEGNRFVLLTQQQRHIDDVIEIANCLLNRLSHPYQIESHELKITSSIGIILSPLEETDAVNLLKHAESAAAVASQNGGNCYQFHTAAIQQHAEHRLHIESDLRRAIKHNQLFLYYQPQVNALSQNVVGMECLIRWHHPEKGLVSPFEFISIAEETDLINDIGQWILFEAFQNTRYWHEQGYPHLRVGINLSPRQFEQNDLVSSIENAIRNSQINPGCVELEITESAAMANFSKTLNILNELKELGVKLSIDDFGTGHSSLSYLQQLPVDTLKIDRAFIKDIGTEKDDGTIARTIIDMAHNLRLHVIAEGIENEVQLQFLQDCQCDEIQGFLFSKPLPGDEFSRFLANPRVITLENKIKSAL